MKRWLLVALFAVISLGQAGASFTYRRKLTINHTQCGSSNSSNFPVLVSLTDATLKTTGNGGHVTNSSGYDIVFYSDTGLSVKLDHEIETYTASTGAIVMWVRIPTVSSSVDTVFYMGYGDPSITTSQQNITGTWNSAYKGVWHLPNGTTLTSLDSTSSAFNGTNSATPPTAGTGQIDGAGVFASASTEYITMGNVLDTDGTAAFSLGIWIKQADTGTQKVMMAKILGTGNGTGWVLRHETDNTIVFAMVDGAGTGILKKITTATFSSTSVWTHVAITYDGSKTAAGLLIYTNGAAAGTTNPNNNFSTSLSNTASFLVGARNAGTSTYNGSLDEARYSNAVRSADWITTEYNNHNSPSTFLTLGAEERGSANGLTIMGVGA
jgi:hypothetical protein